MGTAVQWSLRWTASGCFVEEIRGPQLTFKWGYDGQQDSGCWEVDSSGLVRVMECDDHEAVLLTTYIRTGCWLQPHLQDRFELELLSTPIPGAGSSGSSSGVAAGGDTTSTVNDSSSRSVGRSSVSGGSSSSDGSGSTANVVGVEAVRNSAEPSSSGHGSGAGGGGGGGAAGTNSGGIHGSSRPTGQKAGARTSDDMVAIGVRVRGKRLRVRVLVRQRDWRLLGFDHRMCADTETWELGEWREWATGVMYPSSVLHKASNGGQHAYLTHEGAAERWYGMYGGTAAAGAATALMAAAKVAPAAAAAAAAAATKGTAKERAGQEEEAAVVRLPAPTSFTMPLLPPIPADTSYTFMGGGDGAAAAGSTTGRDEYGSSSSGEYDSSCSSSGGSQRRVPLWRAASGHFLVRPVVNGQQAGGYFVLDTGASGFVITPEAAARLGGQAFGEIHAASISGKVAARFVRVNSWALGGLTIRKPVLMVMELEGLVRGAPGEVVGIVGHDLFRRAVVELPELIGRPSGRGDSGGNGSAATRHSSAPKPRSGSGSDWDSASEDEGGAAGGEWIPPAPVAVPVASKSGNGTAALRFGPPPPASRSTPAVPAPAGSAAVHPASASAAVAAATTATATAPAPASSGCSDADAAVPAVAAAAERSAGGGAATAAALASASSSSRAASGGAASALAASGTGAAATAATPRCAPLSHGNTGMRTAGGVGGNGGTDSSGSSLGGSSEHGSIESDVGSSSSSGSSLSRSSSSSTSSTSTSGGGLGGPGDLSTSSSNSGSSSSSSSGISGSGSGKAVGGARRSAGRSQTARAVRRTARAVPYTLHDIVLHHPLEYDKDLEWVWHPLVMIANLPHIHLRFAAPDGAVRSTLLMLDSGACGADIMLHARAQRELGLPGRAGSGGSSEGGRTQGHYLRGVGQDPKDFVQLQVLDLPWLEMAGVRFEQVRCMCAAIGGLDISVYSHGILCGDLLARVEWAMDYTHKRIGFRRGASAPRVLAGAIGT